jgi:hypothetical protein
VEYNCTLAEVDWLDACIVRVVGAYWLFSSSVGVKFLLSRANGMLGLIYEEIYQTLLTNKKKGNLGKRSTRLRFFWASILKFVLFLD